MGRMGSSQPNSHTSLCCPPPPTVEEDASNKPFPTTGNTSSMTLLEPYEHDSMHTSRPTGNSYPTIIVRVCYVLLMCGILGMCICYIAPVNSGPGYYFTQSSASMLWLAGALYIFFSAMTILLLIIYLIRTRRTTTTVIPCIHTWWYRTYTLVLVTAMITLIVLSGLFTRRTACGKLIAVPPMYDWMVCSGTPVDASRGSGPIGFVSREQQVTPQLWYAELNDGWCSGTLGDKMQPLFFVSELSNLTGTL